MAGDAHERPVPENTDLTVQEAAAPLPAQRITEPFEPTEEDRESVLFAYGCGLKAAEVRMLVINPRTGKPIGENTFYEHFGEEMARARAIVKAQVAGNLVRMSETSATAAKYFLDGIPSWVEERTPKPDSDNPAEKVKMTPLEAARRIAFSLRAGAEARKRREQEGETDASGE